MGYLDDFFAAAEGVFNAIRTTQRTVIEEAAEAVAERLANGGALCVMDTGHMLKHEAFNRAGGLMTIAPFSYALHVENPLEHREEEQEEAQVVELEARTVALALERSRLRSGDVLIINSNSGRTPNVIETALQCRERDIVTIGISSSAQMRGCEAAHPSGKKLFDVVDIALDNCTPFGDAAVEVKDNEKMCPMSGMAGAYCLWAMHAEVVERLQARGVNPTIFRSVHVSGGGFVEEQRKKFREKGI
ncbi:MAG: sugar isomerase domain-containing protein [Candidatus Hydrogenedentota bacterium]